jgi:uncharacterized membrane protein YkvA (DUF1232 family)
MSWWAWLVVAGVVAVAVWALFVGVLVLAGRRADARAVATFVPDCVVLFQRLLADERVPRRQKVFVGALVGYLVMPFDLVPDFIPVAGQLDDAIVVAIVLRSVIRAGGPQLLREHWPGPTASLNVLMRLTHGSSAA